MEFKANTVLLARDKTEVIEKGKPITFSFILINLLDAPPTERKLSGEEKFKRFKLQLKLHEAETVDLTPSEISIIKSVLDDSPAVNPFLYGQIMSALGE